jgi:hypothetical protein
MARFIANCDIASSSIFVVCDFQKEVDIIFTITLFRSLFPAGAIIMIEPVASFSKPKSPGLICNIEPAKGSLLNTFKKK